MLRQAHEAVEDIDPKLVTRPAHELRLLEVHAFLEHAEPGEEALERRLKEIVAPCDRRLDRALPVR